MNLSEFAPPIGQHTVLNPKLWDHNQLKSAVRGALLRISEDFIQYVAVPVKVVDIVVSGGNANYTYTNKSDVDLHIIADFSQTPCDREVEELFDTKRLLYREEYDLTVLGIPVELYIEDQDHPAVSAAYSILQNKWIRPPEKNPHPVDEEKLEKMVNVWKTLLKHAIKSGDLQTLRKTVKLLRKYRKMGLRNTPAGEYSIPNLVYKSLRNDETLSAVTRLIDQLHSKNLSI
jgi:hypothetical protein